MTSSTGSSVRVRSIMVVDDSRVQRAHAVGLCHALGFTTVHEACHGADALEQLGRLEPPPEALIVDLEMPVMDGVELIEQLHERRLDIPFIVASTRESALVDVVMKMARTRGQRVERAMRKPLTRDALDAALRSCMHAAPRCAGVPPADTRPVDIQLLERAIASGAIVTHYQPKVDMRTGLICGVEALARWTDSVLGNVAPDRFIGVAEQCGRIRALTLSVLEQSLAQAARWKSRGLTLSIAVNLSPKLLESRALVDEIGAIVHRHGLKPEQVMLEITEGAVVCYQGAALGTLARLRLQGYGLSIDDYGTGFSSMQQLSRIPFTELKIDRSFVDGAHANEGLRAILQSAVETATRLDIASVAEGIETLADWQLLRRFGCSIGQGWLIGRAMPAAELRPWLKRHEQRLPQLRAESVDSPDSLDTP